MIKVSQKTISVISNAYYLERFLSKQGVISLVLAKNPFILIGGNLYYLKCR